MRGVDVAATVGVVVDVDASGYCDSYTAYTAGALDWSAYGAGEV